MSSPDTEQPGALVKDAAGWKTVVRTETGKQLHLQITANTMKRLEKIPELFGDVFFSESWRKTMLGSEPGLLMASASSEVGTLFFVSLQKGDGESLIAGFTDVLLRNSMYIPEEFTILQEV